MNDNENNKLTHGLLLEDFKQNLLNLVSQHTLDIQTKAVVLDYINIQIQSLAKQQTQKEYEEYNQHQKNITNQTTETVFNNNVSEKASK